MADDQSWYSRKYFIERAAQRVLGSAQAKAHKLNLVVDRRWGGVVGRSFLFLENRVSGTRHVSTRTRKVPRYAVARAFPLQINLLRISHLFSLRGHPLYLHCT